MAELTQNRITESTLDTVEQRKLTRKHILSANHNRVKYIYPVVFLIFFVILSVFWIFLPSSPYFIKPGGQYILAGHILAIIVSGVSTIACNLSSIRVKDELRTGFGYFLNLSAFLTIISLVLVGYGDILVYKTSIAYIGTIICLSIIYFSEKKHRLYLFFLPMIILLLLIWSSKLDLDFKVNQTVNISAFTTVSWFISGYMYKNQVSLYLSRLEKELLLKKMHTMEIEQTKRKTLYNIATTIAHEFNNPLQIIQNASDLITVFGKDKESAIKAASKIPEQINRMRKLIDKLLNISDLEEKDYTDGVTMLNLHTEKISEEDE